MRLPLENTSDGVGHCHPNCIILLMRPQFDGYLLVQSLVRPLDDTPMPKISDSGLEGSGHTPDGRPSLAACYHAHSFLINPALKQMVDATNGDEVQTSTASEFFNSGIVRRVRLFSRDKALYWCRKTGQLNVWDEFIQKVEYDEGKSDWSALDAEPIGHPILDIMSVL